jgi:isopentenyl diphosphate isomerase/L-lactate dehydrogenase-like FMN-dependent dehydrogenase
VIRYEEAIANLYRGLGSWPISPEDWEARAGERLAPAVFDYVRGGAGSESTIRANAESFERWRLVPRTIGSRPQRDLSVEILGVRHPAPLFLAPIGGIQTECHPEGELAVGRAAAALGLPLILSNAASHSMERVAEVMPDTPRWFQLYWYNDRDIVASFVRRAERSGYGAIVVTLDVLTLAWRDRELKNAYLPFLLGTGVAQFTSDPVFLEKLGFAPAGREVDLGLALLRLQPNLALRWEDFAWLRELTRLPILVKGIVAPADALLAFDAGLDGVIVSNHGGRQVDGAIAALDALAEIRDAVGPDRLLLMDGGVRRGSHVLKAIALGARAVLVGRPYVYGLAVGGQAGVEQVLRNLLTDLGETLALCGQGSIGQVDRSLVRRL